MAMLAQDYSHVANFTGYMKIVLEMIQKLGPKKRILDIPAGNGLLIDHLREAGHECVAADINRAKPDYVYADLDSPLPFPDASFDVVTAMEGIEHTLDPSQLIRELCRITRPGGSIIITLPNVQNVYSRFNFLCTGYFYQFHPGMSRYLEPGVLIDRGHIAPISYLQLRYLFRHHGAPLAELDGDRWKKKWLIPFALPFLAIGKLWIAADIRSAQNADKTECASIKRDLFSQPLLFSRSLVLRFGRLP
jgi:SAM-dependent methyltransferase